MSVPWDPKYPPYREIHSDYLSPVEHPENIKIDLAVEVYYITYDRGHQINSPYDYNICELEEPAFIGTLTGKVTSANFSVDSTSDMRTTGFFSIILDKDSESVVQKFLPQANNFVYWQQVWFKAIKKYEYPNNGGLTDEFTVGWFAPNDGSYNYNAETKEFSVSCTDILSFYSDERGGHLTPWDENTAGIHMYHEVPSDTYKEKYPNDYEYDIKWIAAQASGIVLEGEKNNSAADLQNNNFFDSIENDPVSGSQNNYSAKSAGTLWQEKFAQYKSDAEKSKNIKKENYSSSENPETTAENEYEQTYRKGQYTDTASLINRLVFDYAQIIPITSVYVRLQNCYDKLPYDMEFDGDTTLYDVLKKITDLYPRQHIYFDNNRCLNLVQSALTWGDVYCPTEFYGNEFSGAALEENWNVDVSGIKNFTVVWGRDQKCVGYYYISDFQVYCKNCHTKFEYGTLGDKVCKKCGGELERLYLVNTGYSIQQLGTLKQVIYNDNILTEEEALAAAKALTYESCWAKKTLNVTLLDRYYNLYSRPDLGVGSRIEYKSQLTGETDLYTIIKWSNDFTGGTITLELEPFFPCEEEEELFAPTGIYYLPTPEFTYSVDENGLMTMKISNGENTKYSLFKIFSGKTGLFEEYDSLDFWHWSVGGMDFLGETCTEDETGNYKIFTYQFKESGSYLITCQAWNPNIHPSGCPNFQIVKVDIRSQNVKYTSDNGEYFTDEDENYYVK